MGAKKAKKNDPKLPDCNKLWDEAIDEIKYTEKKQGFSMEPKSAA